MASPISPLSPSGGSASREVTPSTTSDGAVMDRNERATTSSSVSVGDQNGTGEEVDKLLKRMEMERVSLVGLTGSDSNGRQVGTGRVLRTLALGRDS